MWPFKRKKLEPIHPFGPMTDAMRKKDGDLYARICHLSALEGLREWKKVHPADFPELDCHPPPPFSKEAQKAMANLVNNLTCHCRIGKITMKG
jgi:hypothetical protein